MSAFRTKKASKPMQCLPEDPTEKDVLNGKEKTCQGNGGNLLLKSIVEERYEEYQQADAKSSVQDQSSHSSKRDIQLEIVAAIKSNGGRFLKRCDPKDKSSSPSWCEVSEKEARRMVIRAFRNYKRRNKKELKSEESEDNETSTATVELEQKQPARKI